MRLEPPTSAAAAFSWARCLLLPGASKRRRLSPLARHPGLHPAACDTSKLISAASRTWQGVADLFPCTRVAIGVSGFIQTVPKGISSFFARTTLLDGAQQPTGASSAASRSQELQDGAQSEEQALPAPFIHSVPHTPAATAAETRAGAGGAQVGRGRQGIDIKAFFTQAGGPAGDQTTGSMLCHKHANEQHVRAGGAACRSLLGRPAVAGNSSGARRVESNLTGPEGQCPGIEGEVGHVERALGGGLPPPGVKGRSNEDLNAVGRRAAGEGELMQGVQHLIDMGLVADAASARCLPARSHASTACHSRATLKLSLKMGCASIDRDRGPACPPCLLVLGPEGAQGVEEEAKTSNCVAQCNCVGACALTCDGNELLARGARDCGVALLHCSILVNTHAADAGRRVLEDSHMNLQRAVDKLLTRQPSRPAPSQPRAGKKAKAGAMVARGTQALGVGGSTIDVLFAKKARKN